MAENWKEVTLAELEPLFEQATLERKWFRLPYYDIWFSPSELRAAHADGRFIRPAVDWELRHPIEHLQELDQAIARQQKARNEFAMRIERQPVP